MKSRENLYDLIVVGAGPAGLTAAIEAQDLGKKVLVLESENFVGGISRTVERDGYRFDLGGHRFFTKVRRVDDFWKRILPPEDFLQRPRKSRIYYNDKFYDYPLKPLNALLNLGIIEATRCVFSYIAVQIYPPKDQSNFEGWVASRFGWRLYRIFFKTYTEKVWGVAATSIQSDWAAQRIKNLSLFRAVINAFGFGKNSQDVTTLINTFSYPRLGPGMLWEKCLELFQERGGALLLNHEVIAIVKEDALYSVQSNSITHYASKVISTLPIKSLPRVLNCKEPDVLMAAEKLKHRDFLIVALVINQKVDFDDNWLYIHSNKVRIGRIQNFSSWSPELVKEGTDCLGLEYFVNEGDEIWSMPDNQLIDYAINEINILDLVRNKQISSGYVVRVPKAYPVYDGEYRSALSTIASWLDSEHPSVMPVGRNGMHRYNNQDHSMLTAMLSVENLFQNKNHDIWEVNVENEYHEEGESKQLSTGRDAPSFTITSEINDESD